MRYRNLKYLYFTSVFLLMCSFYHLSFTWDIHRAVWSGIASLFSLIYMSNYKHLFLSNKSKRIICVLLFLWYTYTTLLSTNEIGALILNITTFIPICSIIYSSIALKKEMLRFMGVATSFILTISLVGWFLYLIGMNLPHTDNYNFEDNFHSYINYYVFLVANREIEILPRFTGMFLEPGQMASVCVLLALSYKIGNIPRWSMIIIIISLVLSFSLAGWIVMLLGLLGNTIVSSTRKMLILTTLFVFSVGLYFYNQKEQNSVINTYIFDRLVLDEEKGIVGNNRTHEDFDIHYSSYINSSDAMFGIARDLSKGTNWTIGNAGYKVFIVYYGIVGFVLIFILLYVYYRMYREVHGLVYVLIYFTLGCIRSFFITPYWFVLLMLSLPLFVHNYRNEYSYKSNKADCRMV